ncbi:DinB family protein [Gemmatimonas sp.]|uniref:DinB family protein n=1 Tax=Gemmatimonas sp. TaxID=1962908 RepID=UPI00286DA7AF|nr:DinB family protein [Gemmatimonas sp.]
MFKAHAYELESTRKFFLTTLSVFDETDSGFAPHPDLYTVAGHVAHAAITVDWFMAGAFGAGWDQEYDVHIAQAKTVTSLDAARTMLVKAFDDAIATVTSATEVTMQEPIPNDVIMNGAPRVAVLSGITDHTAHHRGSLAVYARLPGKVAPMPYA